jgi:hypothetical protein
MKRSTGAALVLAVLCLQLARQGAAQAASSTPAQPQVTAQQGQTAEQQKKDLQDCYDIAKAKTGVDPQALTGLMGKGKGTMGAAASQASDTVTGAAGSAASATQKPTGQAGQSGQANAAADESASAAGSAANNSATTKMDLFSAADQGCLKARGYLVKGEAPAATQPPPQ